MQQACGGVCGKRLRERNHSPEQREEQQRCGDQTAHVSNDRFEPQVRTSIG